MRPEIQKLLADAQMIVVDDSGSTIGRDPVQIRDVLRLLGFGWKTHWGDSTGLISGRLAPRSNAGGPEMGLLRMFRSDALRQWGVLYLSEIVVIFDDQQSAGALSSPQYAELRGIVALCYNDITSNTTATSVATTVQPKGTNVKYNISTDDAGKESVSVVLSRLGKVLVADGKHPSYAEIIEELRTKNPTEERVQELFDVSFVLGQKFESVGGADSRLTVSKGRIYLDHEEVDDDLTAAILRFYTDGSKDLTGLVAFFHKQLANPNPECVSFLYGWLKKRSWSICDDGDFIGYKNVEDKTFLSWSAGSAIVDGVLVEGRIPNVPGSIVEMPRKEVEYDPKKACTNGLHVGTFEFARSFHGLVENGGNGVIVKVKINPMNVVSVPTETTADKMRVCKYVVTVETEKENASAHEPAKALENIPAASDDDGFAKYLDYTKAEWENTRRKDMRVIGKAWNVGTVRTSKSKMVTLLTAEAKKRRKAN